MAVKSHSHGMARNCTQSWLSCRVAIASSSTAFTVFERGGHDEQNKDRGLERLPMKSCHGQVFHGKSVGETMAVSIPYPVSLCTPFLLFSFSFLFIFVTLVEEKTGTTCLERVWEARRKDSHTHISKWGSSLLSLEVCNDYSGTSDLPQAQWDQQCPSSFDLMGKGN